MPNQNGQVYGLTFLSPIIDDDAATPSHDLQIRNYLAELPTDSGSPFALAPGTHLARLVVLDDLIYVGSPAREEHLKSKYLVFESNCDGDQRTYLRGLATSVPQQLDAIWGHCVGYPGSADITRFIDYMEACQIETTFFFAAVNDRSVPETLVALRNQQAVSDFIASHQDKTPVELQSEFVKFARALRAQPVPKAGVMGPARRIKTGGRNE